MNAQFIPQQERTEEEEQRIIKELKQSIELSHQQMHELVSNEEELFVQKITFLNNISKQKINKKTQLEISEALVYLAQAEKILQYAAGCGKNINRQLIISVLHNQACVYQILWELDQCSNYLEALIYNYQNFFKETSQFSVPPSCINPSSFSQINFQGEKMFGFAGGSQISYASKMKDPQIIGKAQVKLLNYYFQHCAVSSQLQKNRKALESAKKGIKLLKNSFCDQKSLLCEEMVHHTTYLNERVEQKYFLLQNLSQMSEKIDVEKFRDIFKSAHFSLQIWTNNRKFSSNSEIRQNQHDKMKQKLKNLAIGTIMQIVPKSFNKMTNEAVSDEQQEGIFSLEQYLLKVFFLSVGYFSVATQLRLLANLVYKNKRQQDKKNSQQYKQSIIYHLIAIIIASLYIPYQCRYILDILASYSKHYSCNLQEYKPVEQQSFEKIILLLGFQKKDDQTLKSKENQKMGRSTKQSASQNKSSNNQYNMSCKSPVIIKNKVPKRKQPLSYKENSDENFKQIDKEKLKTSRKDLGSSQVKKSRAQSKSSRMKRSTSKQQVNIKDKIQRKYSELQKILSSQNLISYQDNLKSPIKKIKSTQKSKQISHHVSKDKIYTKKKSQKQRDDVKTKQKIDNKTVKQRKTKNSDKKDEQKNPKPTTITEEDEQFFFYMTKKTTKTNNNQNGMLFFPKESVKSIGSSRRSTGKKSSLANSRSNSKNSPRVFGSIQSPVASTQSPISRGLAGIKKIASEKKSANPKITPQTASTALYKNYF